MYDILQLNDMLVPELQDIAEQLSITNVKKLNKQDLIYKILDSQAVNAVEKPAVAEKPKRKRTVKAARVTANNNGADDTVATDTAPPPVVAPAEQPTAAVPQPQPAEKAEETAPVQESEESKKRRKRKPVAPPIEEVLAKTDDEI